MRIVLYDSDLGIRILLARGLINHWLHDTSRQLLLRKPNALCCVLIPSSPIKLAKNCKPCWKKPPWL